MDVIVLVLSAHWPSTFDVEVASDRTVPLVEESKEEGGDTHAEIRILLWMVVVYFFTITVISLSIKYANY